MFFHYGVIIIQIMFIPRVIWILFDSRDLLGSRKLVCRPRLSLVVTDHFPDPPPNPVSQIVSSHVTNVISQYLHNVCTSKLMNDRSFKINFNCKARFINNH